MKKTLVFAALAASVVLVSGCDMFRRMAGRPTSSEIAEKREWIEFLEQEKAEQARLDSLEQARKQHEADSVAAAAAVAGYRYHIVLGSFSVRENAERLAAKAEQNGFPATLHSGASGMTSVTVCPTPSREEAREALKKVLAADFTQAKPWISEKK